MILETDIKIVSKIKSGKIPNTNVRNVKGKIVNSSLLVISL